MTELPTLILEGGNDEPLTLTVRNAAGQVPAGLATATLFCTIRRRLSGEVIWEASSNELAVLDPEQGTVLLTIPANVTLNLMVAGRWYRMDVVVVTDTGAVDTIYKAEVVANAPVTTIP